jgi:hypothetical protein
LREGVKSPETRFDETRGLNVLPDGRALVDIGLDGGTVTGTKAVAERDDADRDPGPTTVTMVQAEGFDHSAGAELPSVGTVTFTEASTESSDIDEGDEIAAAAGRLGSGAGAGSKLLGTITNTAIDAESSDVD